MERMHSRANGKTRLGLGALALAALTIPLAAFASAEEPAAELTAEGLPLTTAARAAVTGPLTDDPVVAAGLNQMVDTYLEDPR